MPHTSRKKKPGAPKRQEVKDEDGWTRITSTGHNRLSNHTHELPGNVVIPDEVAKESRAVTDLISPAQYDPSTTFESVQIKYRQAERKLLNSDCWRLVRGVLQANILPKQKEIDKCVVLGTGTFSGYYRGWVGRHEVAMLQVAIFKSIADIIENVQGTRPRCYAQEPRYNDIDRAILASLQVEMVDHPSAFDLLTSNSFAYTPGAELDVQLRTIFHDPALLLSSRLDHYVQNTAGQVTIDHVLDAGKQASLDLLRKSGKSISESQVNQAGPSNNMNCQLLEKYRNGKEVAQLPNLDADNYPFYNMHLYWRSDHD